MKKLFLAIVMLAGSIAANAGVFSFSKANYEVVAGGTVVIPIQLALDASEESVYKNIECKITLSDANFTKTAINMAANRLVAGKAYQNEIAGATIMSVGKTNDALFVGTEGDFFLLTISADAGLSAGAECTITLKEGLGGNVSLVETPFEPASPITATITVVDYVTLDENETFTPSNITKDVHLIRSFEAGKYYTLMLPFAANANMWKATLGDGNQPTIYQFTGVTMDDDPATTLTFNFTTKTLMSANQPYIILANVDAVNPVFANAAVKEATSTFVKVDEEDFLGVSAYFRGTYTPGTVVPAGAVYLKDAKFYTSQGGTKIKGTRAYMDVSEFSGNFAVKLCLDGVETGIDAIDTDLKAEGWYDLNGRKLAEKPATKGVYINNGKKVVVK